MANGNTKQRSTGFSLWGLIFAKPNPHRLKPVLLDSALNFYGVNLGVTLTRITEVPMRNSERCFSSATRTRSSPK